MLQRVYTFYVAIIFFVYSIIICSLSTLVGLIDRTGKTSHYINILWGKLVLCSIGVRVERKGTENILLDQPMVIVANHRSFMDIPVFFAAFPLQFKWVSKDAVFKVPFIGWAMKMAGYISIDRKQKAGNRSSLQQSVNALKAGASLIIFPEGTIPSDTILGDFHPGAFSLAAKNKVPLLPVTVSGTEKILPRYAKLFRPGKVQVTIHPAILPENQKRGELRTAAREAILKGLER